jgi:superfamily I DNA/RNA helicase
MFQHLNPDQQRAVLATEGRILILAGAGSGKTSVLTYRMAHLIRNRAIPPEAILGLTFTNKAAQEMRQRLSSLLSPSVAKKVTLTTFHSFCMQVLRKEIHHLGYGNNFTLYDEHEVQRLGRTLARHLLEHEGELPSLESTFSKISAARASGEPLAPGEGWHDTFTADLYERLKTSLRAYNAVDFDSLLSLTVDLFDNHPTILSAYQDRYHYAMIDEYQDTSPIQYRLAELLAAKRGNLCVVGDDDQSIYGWRGADVKNILEFKADTQIKLEQNYRSTPTILKAANALIAHNSQRLGKQLWSSLPSSHPLTLFHAPSELDEAQAVIQRMIKLHREQQIPWKEMAILYRSNLLSRPFETALSQAIWEKEGKWIRGIPFQVFGGTEFYARAEVKDLIAYLRAISNPLDQEALLRIINTPRRGISDQTLDTLTQLNRKEGISLWTVLEEIASPLSSEWKMLLSSQALPAIRSFVSLLQNTKEKFDTLPLHEALSWMIEAIDYKRAIGDDVKSDKMREFKWENVTHCVDTLKRYEEETPESERSLSHFLNLSSLDPGYTKEENRRSSEESVHLMTFHSAKGLEFTACYLVGLEDHIIPHEKSLAETGLEEERRLMYVALTRAKTFLTLSMARQRKRMGKEMATTPSRFLLEIPKEVLHITSHTTL